MVFIELEKAYNKVVRKVLWRCPEARGVQVACIREIKNMYERAKTRVRTVGSGRRFRELPYGDGITSEVNP